ncbi:SAGA-associated factor 29 homolog A-like isoform X2 [Wolffia australiana]
MSGVELPGLFEKAKELDQLRKDQEEVLSEINKIHKKLQSTQDMNEKSLDNMLLKLRTLYARAKDLSESEISASGVLIERVDSLLQTGLSASQRKKIEVGEQKKRRIKQDSDTSRIQSATIRNQIDPSTLMGEQVAAKVTEDAEKSEWFIVKVMHFDREAKAFEVLDEDPGDDEEPKRYKLHMSRIIPFPKRGDISNIPDYPSGRAVLAVYPGTTALYKIPMIEEVSFEAA